RNMPPRPSSPPAFPAPNRLQFTFLQVQETEERGPNEILPGPKLEFRDLNQPVHPLDFETADADRDFLNDFPGLFHSLLRRCVERQAERLRERTVAVRASSGCLDADDELRARAGS